jgi:hypothetical protein
VRRREFDLVAHRAEERTGRLAHAGRDALHVAAREVHHEDLVEGVRRVALALKYQALAVRRPVAFAGALAFDGEPAHARQEVALLVRRRRLLRPPDQPPRGETPGRGTDPDSSHGAYYHRVILSVSTWQENPL